MMMNVPLFLAFSSCPVLSFQYIRGPPPRRYLQLPSLATTAATNIDDPYGVVSTSNGEKEQWSTTSKFNPLGPPTFLSDLHIGESYYHDRTSQNKNITRLSSLPDIFLIRDMISSHDDREMLINFAVLQGMKTAGTKSSEENTVRKHSYLTWIDPHCINNGDGDSDGDAVSVTREIIVNSRQCFSHEAMNHLMDKVERLDHSFAEDMQVAKYDAGGRFDYHHDGYGRYLTVLTYLNGVGGTYFPFGNMNCSGIDFIDENQVSVMASKRMVEQGGILIAGKEGANTYTSSHYMNPKHVIEIKAGDAIAFYSYDCNGDKDHRSLHCSLTVPEEKWISTCWFRSEALTGPFKSMKKARMQDDWMGIANSIM